MQLSFPLIEAKCLGAIVREKNKLGLSHEKNKQLQWYIALKIQISLHTRL